MLSSRTDFHIIKKRISFKIVDNFHQARRLTIWLAGDPDRTLDTTAIATTIAMVTKRRKAILAITLPGALEFRIAKLNSQ
jgi:hypothetical protein